MKMEMSILIGKEKIQDLMEVTSVKRIHQSDWQTNGVPF